MIIPVKTPKGRELAIKVSAHHNGDFTINICKPVTEFGLETTSAWGCSPYFVNIEESDEEVKVLPLKDIDEISGNSTKDLSDKIKQALQIASKL